MSDTFDEIATRITDAALQRLQPIQDEYRVRVRRFLTAGNAGGLISSLTLAGSMIATTSAGGPAPELPWSVYGVTFLFFLGLAGVGLSLFTERGEHEALRDLLFEDALDVVAANETECENFRRIFPPKSRRARLFMQLKKVGNVAAWCGLLVGSLAGMVVLASFTQMPL